MIMSLFPLKLYADDIFLVSNRTLLYYDLLLIVTAVFKGMGRKALILLGFLDENVEFTPYLHLWKSGSVIKIWKNVNVNIKMSKSSEMKM